MERLFQKYLFEATKPKSSGDAQKAVETMAAQLASAILALDKKFHDTGGEIEQYMKQAEAKAKSVVSKLHPDGKVISHFLETFRKALGKSVNNEIPGVVSKLLGKKAGSTEKPKGVEKPKTDKVISQKPDSVEKKKDDVVSMAIKSGETDIDTLAALSYSISDTDTDEKENTRSHLPVTRYWTDQERIDQIKEDTKLDIREAMKIMTSFDVYSSDVGYYKKIRDGKAPEHLKNIETYIKKAPVWDGMGTLYRGISLKDDQLSNFKEGSVIDMKGLSSWSSDNKVAEKFTTIGLKKKEAKDVQKVIFVMEKCNSGTAISHLSEIPIEKEIVVSSKTKFKIKKIESSDKKTTTIYVEES